MKMRSLGLVLLAIVAVVSGCARGAKFRVGDYIIPRDARSPDAILKVVAVDELSYRVFTHLFSNGRLIQAEDYLDVERKKTEQNYVVVAPSRLDGTFSPDKFLSRP